MYSLQIVWLSDISHVKHQEKCYQKPALSKKKLPNLKAKHSY